MRFSRLLTTFCLALAGFWPALPLQAQTTACIDGAVIQCFNSCSDPLSYQDCIIGCAIAANNDPRTCDEKCPDTPVCAQKCNESKAAIQSCTGPTTKVNVAAGAPTFNRAIGAWQQAVRITNNTPFETLSNLVLVLDAPSPGWVVTNQDGITSALPTTGDAYKNVLGTLAPAASTTIVVTYSRSGTPAFGVTPLVYQSTLR